MRKMYFAMIPKRSFLEDAAIAVGVGAGLLYGAKWLLGDEAFNAYKDKLKSQIYNVGAAASDTASPQGPDTGMGIGDDDAKAREEETIVERIRRAAKSSPSGPEN